MSFLSQQEHVSDGTLRVVPFSIAFLDVADLHFYIGSDEVTTTVPVGGVLVQQVTQYQVALTTPVPAGVVFSVRRVTPRTSVPHIFNNGAALFNAANTDWNNMYALFIVQEVYEQSGLGPFPGITTIDGTELLYVTTGGVRKQLTLATLLDQAPDVVLSTFKDELANRTDPLKGAGMVGRSVASLADYSAVRALTSTCKSETIYVTGPLVTVKPSGISGIFQPDTADTTSADNGGTILVDASARRWKREFNGYVFSPEWFGAKGDKVVDDTLPIQAAFDAINVAKRGELRLSNLYRVTSYLVLPKGVTVRGASVNIQDDYSCGFYVDANTDCLSGEASISRYDSYSESITLENFSIVYASKAPATANAIRLISNSYSRVRSIYCYGAGVGLGVNRIQDCQFSDLIFSNCTNAVKTISGAPSGDWMTMCAFERIYSSGASGTGFIFDIPTLTSRFDVLAADGSDEWGFNFSKLDLCTVSNIYTELNKQGGVQAHDCKNSDFGMVYVGVSDDAVVSSGYSGLYTYSLTSCTFKNTYVAKDKQNGTAIPSPNLYYFIGGSTGVDLIDYDSNNASPLVSNITFSSTRRVGENFLINGVESVESSVKTTSTTGVCVAVGGKPTICDVYITGLAGSADVGKYVKATVFKQDNSTDGVITTQASGGGAALTYVNGGGSVAITGFSGTPQIKVVKRTCY